MQGDFFDSVNGSISALFSQLLESAFGPAVDREVLGSLTWIDVSVMLFWLCLVLVVNVLVAVALRRKARQVPSEDGPKGWRGHISRAFGKPLYLLIWVFGIYLALTPLLSKIPADESLHKVRLGIDKTFGLCLFVGFLWLFFRFTHVLEARLDSWAARTESKFDDLLVPLFGRTLRIIIPVVGIIFALPLIGLPQDFSGVIGKASSILIILVVSWILSQGVHLGERAVMVKCDISAADNLQARKMYTQVHVISRTLYVVIAIFTVASVLMLFDEVRRFGASILASAGVVGVIAGFAAQRTIANLFAGFQVALTQPIRIEDVVVVEGERGRVEEITLTYVVIHIWDDRRLVLPLSYFIEKPFQNWTRATSTLTTTVDLWTDFTVSLDDLRKAAKGIIEASPLWDRRFWKLQVVDANDHAMQIRLEVTAADSARAWDLRCEIREKLLKYIHRKPPAEPSAIARSVS